MELRRRVGVGASRAARDHALGQVVEPLEAVAGRRSRPRRRRTGASSARFAGFQSHMPPRRALEDARRQRRRARAAREHAAPRPPGSRSCSRPHQCRSRSCCHPPLEERVVLDRHRQASCAQYSKNRPSRRSRETRRPGSAPTREPSVRRCARSTVEIESSCTHASRRTSSATSSAPALRESERRSPGARRRSGGARRARRSRSSRRFYRSWLPSRRGEAARAVLVVLALAAARHRASSSGRPSPIPIRSVPTPRSSCSPGRGSRLPVALELFRAHVAPTLAISRDPGDKKRRAALPAAAERRLLLHRAAVLDARRGPRGFARLARGAPLAASRDRQLALPPLPGAACSSGAAPARSSARSGERHLVELAIAIGSEWAKLALAETTRRGC